MEAFQAGCEDYIDRQRPPAVIASHIRQIVVSKAEGFQPTQMLAQADTSLSGSLTHHDLPGVLQMLGHAHQTGALHINAGATDALLFFDAGVITHAECGNLFGDEAVIHIIKSCVRGGQGVYKFVYGATSNQHTVLRNATDLMLDAMRAYDESSRDEGDNELPSSEASATETRNPLEAVIPEEGTTPVEPSDSASLPQDDQTNQATTDPVAPNSTSPTFSASEENAIDRTLADLVSAGHVSNIDAIDGEATNHEAPATEAPAISEPSQQTAPHDFADAHDEHELTDHHAANKELP